MIEGSSQQQWSMLQENRIISSNTKRKYPYTVKACTIFQNPAMDSENLAVTNFLRNQESGKVVAETIKLCCSKSVEYDYNDANSVNTEQQQVLEQQSNSTLIPLPPVIEETIQAQRASMGVTADSNTETEQQLKPFEAEVLNLDYDFSCEDRETTERPLKRRSTCLWMIIDENDCSSQNDPQELMDIPSVIEKTQKNPEQTVILMESKNIHPLGYVDEHDANSPSIEVPQETIVMQRKIPRQTEYQAKNFVDQVYCTPKSIAKESSGSNTAHISISNPPLKETGTALIIPQVIDPRETDSFQRVLASFDEPLLLGENTSTFPMKQIETASITLSASEMEQQINKNSERNSNCGNLDDSIAANLSSTVESGAGEVNANECSVLHHDDDNGIGGNDDDDGEEDNNIAELSAGRPQPKSKDADEMFSQFTELDKLQFDKVYSKRKMELEMQAETRARSISARWAKEGLSLQTIIDTALKDYIELYENAHALRLQFEAEKEAWKKSAMENMQRDPDSDRYQKQKTCATCSQFGGQSMYPTQSREWGSVDDGHWGNSMSASGNKGSAYGDSFWGGSEKLLYTTTEAVRDPTGGEEDMDDVLQSPFYPPKKEMVTTLRGAEAAQPYGNVSKSHYGYKGKHDRQFDPVAVGLTIQKPFQPPTTKSLPPKSGK